MRGVTFAIFIVCASVFSGFMAAGVNQQLGLSMNSGLQDDAQQVEEQLGGDQQLNDRGGSSGLLGFAVYSMGKLGELFVVVGSIHSTLSVWGAPTSLAAGIELIVRIIQSLAIVWVARGVIGE